MSIESYIDHTLLKATATISDIKKLCLEAKNHNLYAVCVNGSYVSLTKHELTNSDVKVAAVIGFPLGAISTQSKVAEAQDCIQSGADEIDMVINIGWLKSGLEEKVFDEIKSIKNAIGKKILKVILETCYLTDEEKELACKLVVKAGADFVKTSTGFGSGGATFDDVILMKKVVGNKARIKASGGIKDKKTALKYIELGVSRIGTSSGPSLLK